MSINDANVYVYLKPTLRINNAQNKLYFNQNYLQNAPVNCPVSCV
jgi:hypothetical protein